MEVCEEFSSASRASPTGSEVCWPKEFRLAAARRPIELADWSSGENDALVL